MMATVKGLTGMGQSWPEVYKKVVISCTSTSQTVHPSAPSIPPMTLLSILPNRMTVPAIAIIGGGPCGLTLANLLERKGIAYVVYERDEDLSSNSEGGSLDLHPNTGQLALHEAGLFEELKKHARYEDTVFSIADKSGHKILEVGQGRDAPEIDRSALRQLLLAAIPEAKIQWGHKLSTVEPGEDGKPILQFTNGATQSGFKLVVGADGSWSKVRRLVRLPGPKLGITLSSFLLQDHSVNP
jgi:2-polyprenyl-6-methoxyphenol hydroxylase-like FAD-dependent oxidoreductase